MDDIRFYSYLSSRVGADPVPTVFLLAPACEARGEQTLAEFAARSGWIQEVEEASALLIAPIVPDGWDTLADDALLQVFRSLRGRFHCASGRGIPGSGDSVWSWEVLIYVVGYGEGAVFAGRALIAHPGFAAATVLVDGQPDDLSAYHEPSDCWLVPGAHAHAVLNCDIPIAVWLMGTDCDGALSRELVQTGSLDVRSTREYDGTLTYEYANAVNPVQRLLVTPGLSGEDPAIAAVAAREFVYRTLRWKNGPDGTLAAHHTRTEFLEGGACGLVGGVYEHDLVEVDGRTYPFALYLPQARVSDVAGAHEDAPEALPLVVSVHGRGEPAWLFSQKNGWEKLADETSSFAVLLPDSPGNIWIAERDEAALVEMVHRVCERWGLDASRVYLTGFSNGAIFTCQMATAHPELFAAASPWNSPGERAVRSDALGSYLYHPNFGARGFEMPFWVIYGDSDDKAPMVHEEGFNTILRANGCCDEPACSWDAHNHYRTESGYGSGERMHSRVFRREDGVPMTGLTVMADMPHGAIADEARATWEFVRHFRRVHGAARVEVI